MTTSPQDDGAAGHPSRRRLGRFAAGALAAGAAAALPATAAAAGSRSAAGPAGAQEHYDRARELAGDDPVLLALVTALTPGTEFPRPPAPAPLRIFDNVAMLSVGWLSATAVLTDGGIVLIDALSSPEEAEGVLVPGLREVGADPAAIAYVVVTHGHEDHFGGAQYLADRYGARVMMAPADWDLVAATRPANAPVRDLDIADGQRLTVGGTVIRLHHTPGHTPGTVSPLIPVRSGGARHTAMLWGGTNPPAASAELRTYLASVLRFRGLAWRAHADVELSNHPNDYGLQRLEQLRAHPEGPNPFVLGRPRTRRYLTVLEHMLRGRLAEAEAEAELEGAAHPRGSGAAPVCC